MLNVQQYLRSGKTLDDLTAELGIVVTRHDAEPLVILNYHQIDSPRTHPIVRECRALCLHAQTYDLVYRSFPRFFNIDEVLEELASFDFSNFHTLEKVDGSLASLYYYGGRWRFNTRGSFGEGLIHRHNLTWQELALQTLGLTSWEQLQLDPSITYILELCSMYNKVVRQYPQPRLYLLTAYRGYEELPAEQVDALAAPYFVRPQRYQFTSLQEIMGYLKKMEADDPTFEGVVICDRHGHRRKIKTDTYKAFHQIRGEGDNLFNPKYLIPFALGNPAVLLATFPEVTEQFHAVKANVDKHRTEMLAAWDAAKHLPSQKEFALAILNKTPFTGILFEARKKNLDPADLWSQAGDSIHKLLYK